MKNDFGIMMAIGLVLGAGVGVATNDMGLGMGVGLALGFGLAAQKIIKNEYWIVKS
ncbi:glycine zipper family protein [Dolosigranulum pigrum]|uniref:glycine zipper family protein n=1 Tax=Dolosigranulum pigrum TaxID=29394 RepID=UPI001AD86DDB|nr:glycine zipper family protein [Dolosigranulum pigrum]QTJ35517.1 glycine zipper family protein [Dolosigranulum pigrum]